MRLTSARFLLLAFGFAAVVPGCGDDDVSPSGTDAGARPDGAAAFDSGTGVDSDVPVRDAGPPPDAPATLERVSSVTDHGVTWTFSEPVLVGRFVTGDYYVVGPVTVSAISPMPAAGRNGSVLNIPAVDDRTGFDDRTESARFDSMLFRAPPIALTPGDRLASSVSVATPGLVDNWLREGEGEQSTSPVGSVSVLTCLADAVPADAFRPSYGDPEARIYRLSTVDRMRLPRLAPPAEYDRATLDVFATRFSRPWIDNLFFGFDAQVDYMPMYGREVARATGIASLLVMLDVPAADAATQEQLLIGLLQRGIDLWGLVRAGHPGWPSFGGHGSGRKWAIVLAGMLLGDDAMAHVGTSYPETQFGEDMHTAFTADLPYGPAWNGATVVYTGHRGVWHGMPVSTDPAWGPYEHLAPAAWLDPIGESYRRCCTSSAWVGEALAARLISAQATWGHDAFFAYVDRWMDPTGDAAYTQQIFDMTGNDFRAAWAAHGSVWDPVVRAMWTAHR